MAKIAIGDDFPAAKLHDLDGVTIDFPAAFAQAPATVVFFYRGRW
jgi:hypothetical protein